MAIRYKKLFHLLLDRNIKKGELQKMAGITASIMARLAKDETVKSDTIGKICDALNCQPGDIMENVPEEKKPEKNEDEVQAGGMSRPFTEEDEQKIDLAELLTNIQYQMNIAQKFDMDVLSMLMEKARQQAGKE